MDAAAVPTSTSTSTITRTGAGGTGVGLETALCIGGGAAVAGVGAADLAPCFHTVCCGWETAGAGVEGFGAHGYEAVDCDGRGEESQLGPKGFVD